MGALTSMLVPASGAASNAMSSYGGQVNPSGDENTFVKVLQKQAYSNQSPLANLAMQQGLDASNANASALAASQRGVSPALAARMAAQSQAQNTQAANIGSAQLGLQSQQQYTGMLGNELQSIRTGQIQQQANAVSANNAAAQSQGAVAGGLLGGLGAAGAGYFKGAATAAAAHGGFIPGKAKVEGDSPENDTVHALLSPGEVVIPRSVMQSDDPGDKAKEFIEQLKSQPKKKGEAPSFASLVQMHKAMGEQIAALGGGKK